MPFALFCSRTAHRHFFRPTATSHRAADRPSVFRSPSSRTAIRKTALQPSSRSWRARSSRILLVHSFSSQSWFRLYIRRERFAPVTKRFRCEQRRVARAGGVVNLASRRGLYKLWICADDSGGIEREGLVRTNAGIHDVV